MDWARTPTSSRCLGQPSYITSIVNPITLFPRWQLDVFSSLLIPPTPLFTLSWWPPSYGPGETKKITREAPDAASPPQLPPEFPSYLQPCYCFCLPFSLPMNCSNPSQGLPYQRRLDGLDPICLIILSTAPLHFCNTNFSLSAGWIPSASNTLHHSSHPENIPYHHQPLHHQQHPFFFCSCLAHSFEKVCTCATCNSFFLISFKSTISLKLLLPLPQNCSHWVHQQPP